MNKYLPYLGLALVLIIIIYLVIYFSQDKTPPRQEVKKELERAKAEVSQWPLRKGSSGPAVGAVQKDALRLAWRTP